jgi:hypothetical protein
MLDANTVEKKLADTQTSRAPIPVKYYGSATNFRDSKLREEDKFGI